MKAIATTTFPEGVRIGNEMLVRLTAAAGNKLQKLASQEDGGKTLRIAITGGGCNGMFATRTRFA